MYMVVVDPYRNFDINVTEILNSYSIIYLYGSFLKNKYLKRLNIANWIFETTIQLVLYLYENFK